MWGSSRALGVAGPARGRECWSVPLMQEAQKRSVLQSFRGARFLAFGFFPQRRDEFGFGVIAYTHPTVDASTTQVDPWTSTNNASRCSCVPVQLDNHGPQTRPANGTSSCWARTRLGSEAVGPGLLT